MIWIGVAQALGVARSALGGGVASLSIPTSLSSARSALAASFSGFTPAVWGVIALKSMNGLLIPATLKYADNILYSYAKPSSIVMTTLVAALAAGALPAPSMLAGVVLVITSICIYNSKPKAR
jgi:UDP-sugar transporter A1/2/3